MNLFLSINVDSNALRSNLKIFIELISSHEKLMEINRISNGISHDGYFLFLNVLKELGKNSTSNVYLMDVFDKYLAQEHDKIFPSLRSMHVAMKFP